MMLGNFTHSLSSCDFFIINLKKKKHCQTVWIQIRPEIFRLSMSSLIISGAHLGLNCLKVLSAEDKNRQRVNGIIQMNWLEARWVRFYHRHLGSVEKNKPPPPPPQPSSPINFCILAFFHLKYDILYAWSYTGVRKNDLEHMENIWKKCILLTMIEKTQDKQLRLCNFEPPSPSKVQCARNTKQTHKTLSPINSIYIYLLPDIGSFL